MKEVDGKLVFDSAEEAPKHDVAVETLNTMAAEDSQPAIQVVVDEDESKVELVDSSLPANEVAEGEEKPEHPGFSRGQVYIIGGQKFWLKRIDTRKSELIFRLYGKGAPPNESDTNKEVALNKDFEKRKKKSKIATKSRRRNRKRR